MSTKFAIYLEFNCCFDTTYLAGKSAPNKLSDDVDGLVWGHYADGSQANGDK